MHTQGQQDVGPRLGSCNANYQHTVLAVAMQISAHTANYAYPKNQQIVGPCLDYCNASYEHTQRIMHAQCQQVVGPSWLLHCQGFALFEHEKDPDQGKL